MESMESMDWMDWMDCMDRVDREPSRLRRGATPGCSREPGVLTLQVV
jgi:hypothetical protein